MGARAAATTVRRNLPPATAHTAADAARYRAAGWWSELTVGEHVRRARERRPDGAAFLTATTRMTWAQYDEASTALAAALASAGLERGQRIAILLPDGPTAHVAYVAAERAGLVVIGIPARSGVREIVHQLRLAEADALLTHATLRATPVDALLSQLRAEGLPALRSVVVPDLADPAAGGVAQVRVDGAAVGVGPDAHAVLAADRQLHPDELFLLNSTSGTTGLPKCVVHTQQAWLHAGRLAVENGGLTGADTILCAVPTPYGFGLWSGHVAPALLGIPTVLLERFDVEQMLELIERERVTMLAAVTTQLAMVLGAAAGSGRDLSSLRVVFPGGEAVPPARAAAFEQLAGAKVLQFYGANETGIISGTTVADSDRIRLHTAGRPAAGVQLRLGADGAAAAVRGPGLSGGYHRDPHANAELLDGDGWMRTGDVLALDVDGSVEVVGRASDIVIRGGKNISAPAVEAEVATHPLVAAAAVVPMPDPVFGERVCVYVAPLRGTPARTLTLELLVGHLAAREMTREWMPERLVVLDELPMSAGGKVDKAALRKDIRRRLETAAGEDPVTSRVDGGGAS
jgi:acyl-CoA synthetase